MIAHILQWIGVWFCASFGLLAVWIAFVEVYRFFDGIKRRKQAVRDYAEWFLAVYGEPPTQETIDDLNRSIWRD